MNEFRVALLQMLPASTQEENQKKGMEYCRRAKDMGADLALFPEMKKKAIKRDSLFVQSFQNLAKELDMAIGITYLEQYDPSPRNSFSLFDRFGSHLFTYAKVHTCDFGIESQLTPGNDFYTADLNTAAGMVKVGAMICFDREFPESARILMLKGAEIILVPNACPMEINRLTQLRARHLKIWWALPQPTMPLANRTATAILLPLTESPMAKSIPASWNPEIL